MTRGMGYRVDPADPRDRKFGVALLDASALPQSASLKEHVVGVLDQSITNSCVAHSTAQALRIALSVQGVAAPQLPSRLFIYYNARLATDDQSKDAGTFIREAFKSLSESDRMFGYCEEQFWPFDPGRVNDQPVPRAYQLAFDQRIDSYERISDGSRLAIMAAIAERHPVVLGLDVDAEWQAYTGGVWTYSGRPIGGHAMCVVGYDGRGVEVVNSWATSWGNAGFGWIAWDTVEQCASDIWVPKIAAQFSEVA